MTEAEPLRPPQIQAPAPRWAWLTPSLCRFIFAVLLVSHFYSGWRYLHQVPPTLDLAGDEAQYWTWSRQPALSYYSKGPLIAYVIRASCALFGQTMPGVRFPALGLAVGTGLCTYWIVRKLYGSDRLALGATLLGALIPMYTAGSLLMTIDPLLYFLWGLSCCLLVKAVFDRRRWPWPVIGAVLGLGFLAKYAALLWLPGALLFLAIDPQSRRWLRSPWPWVMVIVALAFTTPVMVWNMQNHWVSLHHVATQTGTNDTGAFARGNLLELLATQFGLLNPFVAIILIAAVVQALRNPGPNVRQARLLLCIGGFYFLVCVLDAMRSKVQANWPVPAYFTLLVLTAHFAAEKFADRAAWRRWRLVLLGAVVFGLAIQPLLSDATVLYPAVTWVNTTFPRKSKPRLSPANVDFEYKLRGVAELGRRAGDELAQLPVGAFAMCEDYQDAAQMQFYLPGRPKTFFAGSYWTDPAVRRRFTQFDMWPDRDLSQRSLRGKSCVYLGTMAYAPLHESFDHVEPLADFKVVRRGLVVRTIQLWKCIGFHGMTRPADAGSF